MASLIAFAAIVAFMLVGAVVGLAAIGAAVAIHRCEEVED